MKEIKFREQELWKDIKGFEGIYQVSNLGNIRSLDRKTNTAIKNQNYVVKKGKMIKPHVAMGYYALSLSKGNKIITQRVHKLVAQTFIPNPENKPCVNHKDGNKLNNRIDNLEWCSHKENAQHAHRTGLYSREQELKQAKLMNNARKRPIQQILNGKVIATYESLIEAERKTGINNDNIWHALNGYCKKAKGYEWKYL